MWRELPKSFTPYLLHPRPAVLVASCSNGSCSAMPAAWVTPVSRNPPYLAVAMAPSRFTYELIIKSRKFSIVVLPTSKLKELHYLGLVSGRDVKDKLERSGLKWFITDYGVPVCEEAIAYAECSLSFDYPCGDHHLVVGEVVKLVVKDDIEIGTPPSYDIPMHVRGDNYARLSGEVIRME